jgi:PAS domain S-box-containing protein
MSESPERTASWEQKYHALLESLPDAVFVQDMHGRLLFVNTSAERLSGFPRQELLAMNMCQLLTPQSHALACDLIEAADVAWYDAELVDLSGAHISVELRVSVEPKLGECYLIVREVTDRDRSIEAARNSESRFRLMAKNLTDMVLAYDMQRRLIFANPAVRDLTGYSPEELERAQFICWIHPDDRERMLSHWDKLFAGESFYEEEYRLITRVNRLACKAGNATSPNASSLKRPGTRPNSACASMKSAIAHCSRTLRFRCGRKTSPL